MSKDIANISRDQSDLKWNYEERGMEQKGACMSLEFWSILQGNMAQSFYAFGRKLLIVYK